MKKLFHLSANLMQGLKLENNSCDTLYPARNQMEALSSSTNLWDLDWMSNLEMDVLLQNQTLIRFCLELPTKYVRMSMYGWMGQSAKGREAF